MNAADQQSGQIERDAREWFVVLQSGSLTDSQRGEFDAWLSARPEHKLAYEQLTGIWARIATLAVTPEGDRLRRSVRSASARSWFGRLLRPASSGGFFFNRPLGAAAAFVLFAVAAGFAWLQIGSEAELELRYATGTSEIRTLQLPDGSQVTLGAKSELRLAFNEQTRTLTLLGSEAFFDVTSDPQRPFVVAVNDIRITVVGTQFDVRKRFAGASVAVLEGRVQVDQNKTAGAGVTGLLLSAGEQVSKPLNAGFTNVQAVSVVEAGAWRNGRLIFRNAPLIDVITDANRYFDGSISLQAREIYDERVTLTLRTDQIDQLPEMLANALPIDAQQSADGRFTLTPATRENQ